MKTILSLRRDRYLARVSIFLIIVALVVGLVGCTDIVFDKDLRIDTWYKLNEVRDHLGGRHILVNDLDSTTPGWEELASETANGGKGWKPIGETPGPPFTGSLDGDGHVIRNLTIDTAKSAVGLFAYVAEGGVIQNVKVVDAAVTGHHRVGALVGQNSGNVSDSRSSGSVSGYDSVGGLVGINEGGTVSDNCYSTGNVTGDDGVGGLVGRNNKGTVSDSSSTGSVNGYHNVGGLVGDNAGTVSDNSHFTGNVTSEKGSCVGGLVGQNSGNVSDSRSGGSVIGKKYVGGLVGQNSGDVSSSRSSVSVTGEDSVGGLVGQNNQGTVSGSYSIGNATGSRSVGGLVGSNDNEGKVENSYSTSSVMGDSWVGGLVGASHNESTVGNSYSGGSVTGKDGVGGLVGFNYKSAVINSHYNYDEVMINGQNVITIGALFSGDFEQWLAKDKSLDIGGRLSQDEDGYYLVNNVTDFKALLALGQNGSLLFRLTSDLDLGNEPDFYIPYFAGQLDGDGHKISNLGLNFGFVYNVGLFGCLAPAGRATELGVEDTDITGGSFVGGLVGSNWEGDVSGSYSTGSVSGYDYVGGLAGSNDAGTMKRCSSRVSVSGNSHVGGLVGRNDKEGTVEDSYSTGSVAGNSSVGGVAGSNGGTVRKSWAGSNVTGSKNYAGGLVGANEATVEESYSTGSVSGKNYVGGLMGQNGYLASNSYSTANVSGNNWVGGLLGENTLSGDVNRCYSAGKVTGKQWVGGLVGQNSQGGDVTRSFWDTDSSGQVNSPRGTGKNTTQMKESATFTGWGIIAVVDPKMRNTARVWNIVNGETYPFLSWQPVS